LLAALTSLFLLSLEFSLSLPSVALFLASPAPAPLSALASHP